MSKLYRYTIIVNRNPVRSKNSFSYSYGGTKDIELCVGKNSASLQFCMTVDHNETSLSKSDIFLDGLLKSAFSHLLIFGETMKVDQVLLLKDDKEAKEINCPQLYYLLEINKKIDVSLLNRKDEILEDLLQSPFRSGGRKLSCMIAYLTAMSRDYYMERFNYLWISYNAFYDEMYAKSGDKSTFEWEHIQYLISWFCLGNKVAKNRTTREKMAKKLYRYISLWDGKEVMEFNVNPAFSDAIDNIIKEYKVDSTPYGFLISDFCYYLRCKYFHGAKPLKLLCYENDFDLKMLDLANKVLEPFLRKHLVDLFMEDKNASIEM